MKGDIALAGFVLTAEEWEALDAVSRVQLISAVMRRDPFAAAAVPAPAEFPEGSAPVREED
jgi:hypothetical protein